VGVFTADGDGEGTWEGVELGEGRGGCVQEQVGTGAGVGIGGFGVALVCRADGDRTAAGEATARGTADADCVTRRTGRWDADTPGAGAACAGRPAGGRPGSNSARIPATMA
jgi:hypothetical protein